MALVRVEGMGVEKTEVEKTEVAGVLRRLPQW